MIQKIQGIVLKIVKYSDHESIVDMFTDKHGRCSFIVRVSRTMRNLSLSSPSLWWPLSVVEFDADVRQNATVHRLKNARALRASSDDILKSCQVFFMAELLYHALKNEPENLRLFEFITLSLKQFDQLEDGFVNFHIFFMVQLMQYIGISPNIDDYTPASFFDMMEGCFASYQPSHAHFLKPKDVGLFFSVLTIDYSTMNQLFCTRTQRNEVLKQLNTYYRLHIPSFPELKSLNVLTTMFD